ncbi:MAG: diguanylate cyclase [Omnitrophica WOR_2 bacterium]
MKSAAGFLSRLNLSEHRVLTLPPTLMAILVDAALFAFALFSANPTDRIFYLSLALAGIFYILFLFLLILPRLKRYAWLDWIISTYNGILTAALLVIVSDFLIPVVVILVITAVTVTAILAGRGPTYLLILIHTVLTVLFQNQIFSALSTGWLRVLGIPILGIMITETIVALGGIINAQMAHMETINRVGREISTTIEAPQVIALVCAAIRDAFRADTYYVGLLDGDNIRLQLLYDEGKLFPNTVVPLGNGPAGWIVQNKRSLLLRDALKESHLLSLKTSIVGQPKPSRSWMGAPLEAGANLLGIIAVASYRPHAYTVRDLELLENITQQAAIAIDNAYHHAQVEEQSRLDSLTQIYNHGYFLVFLNEYVQNARLNHAPLSLMMLDIDYFKQYNDNYGHLIGDQVLLRVVETIRANVRSTDIIGRWGGEEFVVMLPDANGGQASQIAERIRQSLSEIVLYDHHENRIPAPTASLGIAICPHESGDPESLVHLADLRLYLAKGRGRNQVEPELSHWSRLAPEEEY